MVVPSRMDNLPQTATGLPDVVEHQRTGYLATHFDPADLPHGDQWLLDSTERHSSVSLWTPRQIAHTHADLYREILSRT